MHQPGIEADGVAPGTAANRVVDRHVGVVGPLRPGWSDQGQDPVAPDAGGVEPVGQGPGLALGPPGRPCGDDVQNERLGAPSLLHRRWPPLGPGPPRRRCWPHGSTPGGRHWSTGRHFPWRNHHGRRNARLPFVDENHMCHPASMTLRSVAAAGLRRLPPQARLRLLHGLGRFAPWEAGFDFTPPPLGPGDEAGPPDFVGIGVQKAGTTLVVRAHRRPPRRLRPPRDPQGASFPVPFRHRVLRPAPRSRPTTAGSRVAPAPWPGSGPPTTSTSPGSPRCWPRPPRRPACC